MRSAAVAKVIPGIAVALCTLLVTFWFSSSQNGTGDVKRVPGQDQAVAESDQASGQGGAGPTAGFGVPGPSLFPSGITAQPGQTVTTGVAAPQLPGQWPRFRNAGFDNISTETTPLAVKWPNGAPPLLWGIDVGEGHAGAAVSNSRVYILDYDRQSQADVLRCLTLADGKEMWHYAYPNVVKRNHGMSRTVPAVSSKYVVTIGPKCHVLCADALSGKMLWMIDLVKDYRTEVPPWYAGQCPLIDGDTAIIAPAGSSLMMAVDCATGKVLWRTPNPEAWTMTHSSIVPMTFKGRKTYVYCASGGVVGVSAKDGSILWQTTDWTVKIANVPTPVLIGDDRIFLCGGYNSGAMMLQLKEQGGKIVPQTLYKLPATVFGSDQQTPIYYKGFIYGVIPGGQLVCLDPGGKPRWASGSTFKFGIGPYLIADGKIFVMDDSGVLTIVDAAPAGFHSLGQARLLNGHDSWGPMALAGGRLIARDLTRMVCVDIARH